MLYTCNLYYCCSSATQLCLTLCNTMDCSTPCFPVHHQFPEPTQTHVHHISDAIQPSLLCCPLILLLSIFPSIRDFSNESFLHIRWPQYWSFKFSFSFSNEYSGLISFRIEWFDLLVIQGILESSPTPQFKSINSLALKLIYGTTLTSIYDHWKNHKFDYTELGQQNDVSAF